MGTGVLGSKTVPESVSDGYWRHQVRQRVDMRSEIVDFCQGRGVIPPVPWGAGKFNPRCPTNTDGKNSKPAGKILLSSSE